MAKLLFDPARYQFYLTRGLEDHAAAKSAGFGWDVLRNRFFTEDPKVAARLIHWADGYARSLLADACEVELGSRPKPVRIALRPVPRAAPVTIHSTAIH
jgi:hypothetical protein